LPGEDAIANLEAMNPTAENIRLLSLFHYVLGVLTYFSSLFPVFHLAAGIFLLLAPLDEWAEDSAAAPSLIQNEIQHNPAEASGSSSSDSELEQEDIWILRVMGILFTGFAAIFMILGFALATAMIIAGRRLAQHRSHTFCLIVAGLECMLFPFHAILGIFTFILLLQPEGRALFGATTSEEASKPES
jgi:hypothetical protein